MRENHPAFPWRITEQGWEYPAHEGVAVWTRPDPPRSVHAMAMLDLGFRQVGEVDDNYLADTRHNIHLRLAGYDEPVRRDHLKSLSAMDAVIFTTEALRDIYRRAFLSHKVRMPELHVCGNHLFREDWPVVPEYDGPVRVGWMGSSSHLWDVNHVRIAFDVARASGLRPIVVGYNPAEPDVASTSRRAMELLRLWRKVGLEHVPWRQMTGHERLVLPFDIGLAPLLYNPFTAGKSDIKAVEYAISGAAVVAHNHPVYNKHWKHMETAILCDTQDDYCRAVLLLAKDEKLRRTLVENAQQYVREERDLVKHADTWRSAVYG